MADVEKVLDALKHCLPTTKEDGLLTCDTCPYYRCDNGVKLSVALIEDMRELLKDQPQVVRCKDCIYNHKGRGFCSNMDGVCYLHYVTDDWFCADGEHT